MSKRAKSTTMIRVREHEKVEPFSKRKFRNRTGMQKTIHNEFLNSKLDERGLAIKKGIYFGLSIIDAEKDSDGYYNNTKDTEIRTIMCCIKEQLEKLD